MMGYKVLFDGNGSNIIQIVGLGLYVPASQYDEVMQKWQQAQAEIEALKVKIKEEAHEAYWDASDNNRVDRWAENFDEIIRQEFEKYWAANHKEGE